MLWTLPLLRCYVVEFDNLTAWVLEEVFFVFSAHVTYDASMLSISVNWIIMW